MLSQAGTTLASPADRTLSQVESMISQAGSTQSPQAGNSQTSTVDSTLSLAESGISQAGSSQSSPDKHSSQGRECGPPPGSQVLCKA